MNLGKLIRLFLVEGDPDGIVTAEIQNMTIYATSFPRTKINVFRKRVEAKKAGTYILIGDNLENPMKPIVYVGEGAPVIDRIQSHNESKYKKDFWDRAIVFSSKDDYLTKTQIQYLESKLVSEINKIQGAIAENIQLPKEPILSEVDRAEMEEFYMALSLLLKTFGYDFLEEKSVDIERIKETNQTEDGFMDGLLFKFKIKEAEAHMKIIDNDYVVLEGSTIVKQQRQHIQPGILEARTTLLSKGQLVEDENDSLYRMTVNYAFQSPSYASGFVAGGNDNGWTSWKYKGKTMSELERINTE